MSGPPLLVSEQSELSVLSGCLLSAVCSLVLRDPQGPGTFYLNPRFRTIFAPFFRNPLFYNDLYQKRSNRDPQNSPKTKNSLQNLTSKRTRGRDLEKGIVWKGSNLQNYKHLYTLSCFFRGPDLSKWNQNGSQNGASGHPKYKTNTKNEHPKTPKT